MGKTSFIITSDGGNAFLTVEAPRSGFSSFWGHAIERATSFPTKAAAQTALASIHPGFHIQGINIRAV